MLNIDDRFLSETDESEMYLMLHIAKHMGAQHFSFPSNETLCQATGWEIKKLQRVKRRCIEKKFLEVKPRYANSKQTSNEYRVSTSRISIAVNLKGRGSEPIPKKDSLSQKGVGPLSQKGVPPLPQKGVTEVLTTEVLTIEPLNKGESKNQNPASPLNTEERNPTPQQPAAPPRPAGYLFEDWLIELGTDYRIREAFTIGGKIPERYFDDYLKQFTAIAGATPDKYSRKSDLTSHFINWSSIRYRNEQPKDTRPGSGIPKSIAITGR